MIDTTSAVCACFLCFIAGAALSTGQWVTALLLCAAAFFIGRWT